MLPPRTGAILKYIIEQYINSAVPVPSQSIVHGTELGVSSATIRNEMAHLEKEGYITRAHPSAGSVPSDKGYRYYVESLRGVTLSLSEQRLVSHLFHQVEQKVEEWVSLAAALLAQLVRNVAVVTMPKSVACKFKHLELVALQDSLGLLVLVLHGAKIKQQLITFDHILLQEELSTIANKLNAAYSGLTKRQVSTKDAGLSATERQLTNLLLKIMREEDEQEYEEPYLDGLHFILAQPEFTQSHKMLGLMELVEHRTLLKTIVPKGLDSNNVQVVIGTENKIETFHDYSVILGKYGIPTEAVGTLGVLGPTRMPYIHTISTVRYLSSILSTLVAGLYGKEIPAEDNAQNN